MSTQQREIRSIPSKSKHKMERQSAEVLLSKGQVVVAVLWCITIAALWAYDSQMLLLVLAAASIGFFVLFISFRANLNVASARYRPPAISSYPADEDLPTYTIFVPLYGEAHMVPKLVESLSRLVYPTDKLQILLLLEENDVATIAAANNFGLPAHFEIVICPSGHPQTKPRACNVGLGVATGQYCVIFDAEDRPDPYQLVKAVATFEVVPDDVVCLQAPLIFWNAAKSWVTHLYAAEYTVHFQWVLPGFAQSGLVPPLGGTSNHFKTEFLRKLAFPVLSMLRTVDRQVPIIGAWDSYNVTEDADEAGAIASNGGKILMFDSYTMEEATDTIRAAIKQRMRWLKGYTQTGLVYTRQPITRIRQMGLRNFLAFNLLMLGTPLSLMLSPIFWLATAIYFVTRSTFIESLFPTPLFYAGMAAMVAGNFFLFYQLMVACMHRKSYSSVKFMFLVPFWWLCTSVAAYRMCFELLRPSKRHVWHKTRHGHDLELYVPEVIPEMAPAVA